MARKTKSTQKSKLRIKTLVHDEATRKNIPTAEYQSIMQKGDETPIDVAVARRNKDLDPQLVWRGKTQDELVVSAPPLFIQEKVHPKVIIDDLVRRSSQATLNSDQLDLFSDFNGLPNDGAKTEFYRHDSHWSNRMILGDSLQVMASLSEREGLRGKVQCIYIDPPYGIQFNSNFQWSTTSRDVKDGRADHITREPEQVKAFRDTWRDGIHTYLSYLRDRIAVSHELLSETGSIFIQIGDENVHLIRSLLNEVFGERNFVSDIVFRKTSGQASKFLSGIYDHIIWFAKDKEKAKYRSLFGKLGDDVSDDSFNCIEDALGNWRRIKKNEVVDPKARRFRTADVTSQGASEVGSAPFEFEGKIFKPSSGNHWKPSREGLHRLARAGRLVGVGNTLTYKRYLDDFPITYFNNIWMDTIESTFATQKIYVVQTGTKVVERCLLMTTDPGDLVLDPTCGSGTTAYVAEQWGRRWITIDTSRVALALARARIMGARYPYYILSDSKDGQRKEAELTGKALSNLQTSGNIRLGFVYERAPHVMLSSISNNTEIDVIYEKWASVLQKALATLNQVTGKSYKEWEVPREIEPSWPKSAEKAFDDWWKAKADRGSEIEKSIRTKAEFELLYDRPFVDKDIVRVAGPFTVESVSPHKVLAVDENDNFITESAPASDGEGEAQSFVRMICETLKQSGVQQAHKEDRIKFSSLTPWPGKLICAEGKFVEEETGKERRAGIFIGPEFGTVCRPDLVEAAKEAGDADFDLLIACAFNFDARSADFASLGRIPVLKARMNADLHMAGDYKGTAKGNLFVIFGEPDIEIKKVGTNQASVKIVGVDVFHPNSGEVKSMGADGIACWFIDTDYNEESFFVRHAYFLGAADPYKALKASLKAEIDEEAWSSLYSDCSRPFAVPSSKRIAVKVINHLGDEVMKVFKVT